MRWQATRTGSSLAVLCAALFGLAAAGQAAPAAIPHDAQTVDASVYPWSAIGKIYNSIGGSCTGVLIAVDRVLTAAHCLYNPRTARFLPASSVHFLLGYDKGSFRWHGRVSSIAVAPGYAPRAPSRAAADWAVLTLAERVAEDLKPLALTRQGLSRGTGVVLAGFARRRVHVMTADLDCRLLAIAVPDGLVAHDCSLDRGSSGAPLLALDADGKARIVGLQIAVGRLGGRRAGLAIAAAKIDPARALPPPPRRAEQ